MDKIKAILLDRKIPFLLHFTKITNLDSIMSHGLIPRSQLDAFGIEAEINDELRLDNHEDTVSVSIAFPNYKMFYKLRMDSDDNWVVLAISPNLLLNNEAAFCQHNAADTRISRQPLENLLTPEAFDSMFDELDTERTREEQKLKPCDPTDSQAEILIIDRIDPKYIYGVVFREKENKVLFQEKYPDKKAWHHREGKGMFATRTYLREYN